MSALAAIGAIFGGVFFVLFAVDKITKAIEKRPNTKATSSP